VKLAPAPFTIVGSGEALTDVARRIYGTADKAEWLWRANRDLVVEPGATVSPGTVLRTPARPGR
jgi:nucleoid-associated protein YgaU